MPVPTSFFKISYIATPTVLFEVILLMEYSTLVKEASAKVTVAKTVIIINHLDIWLPRQRVDYWGIARSIL